MMLGTGEYGLHLNGVGDISPVSKINRACQLALHAKGNSLSGFIHFGDTHHHLL